VFGTFIRDSLGFFGVWDGVWRVVIRGIRYFHVVWLSGRLSVCSVRSGGLIISCGLSISHV
jgi:hypothetical protein